jgi:hypothetical protein
MFGIFRKKMPEQMNEFVQRRVRMATLFCTLYTFDRTVVEINSNLTPVFDNVETLDKLGEAFDYFNQFSSRLVNLFPTEKRDEVESFISEFMSDVEDDGDAAYYVIASMFLLHMVHMESLILLRAQFPRENQLWDLVESTGRLLHAAYLDATQGRASSAVKIAPRFFELFPVSQ